MNALNSTDDPLGRRITTTLARTDIENSQGCAAAGALLLCVKWLHVCTHHRACQADLAAEAAVLYSFA